MRDSHTMPSPLEELCEIILVARAKKDELKAKVETASAELLRLEEQLAMLMKKQEQTKVVHANFVFSPLTKVAWKTVSEEKENLLTLLKEGAPELVKESVNTSSLSAFLRKNEESLESESAPWWTAAKACLTRTESQALSVRKKSKKKT